MFLTQNLSNSCLALDQSETLGVQHMQQMLDATYYLKVELQCDWRHIGERQDNAGIKKMILLTLILHQSHLE